MDDDARNTLADWVSTPQEIYPDNNQSTYPPFQIDYGLAEPYNISPIASFPSEQHDAFPYVSQEFSNNNIGNNDYNQVFWPQNNDDGINYQQPDISQAGWNQEGFLLINEYMMQPGYDQAYESSANSGIGTPATYEQAYFQQADLEEASPVNHRSRRTERSKRSTPAKKLLSQLKERMGQSENQETMLDGLPSPVRPEDAFHEPIYPQSYHYQDVDRKDENGQLHNN